MKVLVIDDNIEITDMLSFYLEGAGYECKVLNDGREGLQAIKSDNFDLVLLDLAMPEFSGMDIINSLNQIIYWRKRILLYLLHRPYTTKRQKLLYVMELDPSSRNPSLLRI